MWPLTPAVGKQRGCIEAFHLFSSRVRPLILPRIHLPPFDRRSGSLSGQEGAIGAPTCTMLSRSEQTAPVSPVPAAAKASYQFGCVHACVCVCGSMVQGGHVAGGLKCADLCVRVRICVYVCDRVCAMSSSRAYECTCTQQLRAICTRACMPTRTHTRFHTLTRPCARTHPH